MSGDKRIVKVGLLGLGTVGSGVVKTILQNGSSIQERTGHEIEISRVLVRNPYKKRVVNLPSETIITDPDLILNDPETSVVIEVMGGVEPARGILLKALRAGKHVITANKELLAKHGAELFQAAAESRVQLLFEASVAGGIPVIRFLQGYLTANRVHEISGILNGTSNYILTQMEQTGQSFSDVLRQAQQLGYAEADPSSDVEGYDTAYKLAILTNLAYDVKVPIHDLKFTGISQIELQDIRAARQFGYVIKLLGMSRLTGNGISFHVGPQLLPLSHPLARVNDVLNAVTLSGDVVGDLTFIGKGAGEYPTASAVVEDLTALLRHNGDVLRPSAWNAPIAACTSGRAGRTHYVRLAAAVQHPEQADALIARFADVNGATILQKDAILYNSTAILSYIIQGLADEQHEKLVKEFTRRGLLTGSLIIPVWEVPENTEFPEKETLPEPLREGAGYAVYTV